MKNNIENLQIHVEKSSVFNNSESFPAASSPLVRKRESSSSLSSVQSTPQTRQNPKKLKIMADFNEAAQLPENWPEMSQHDKLDKLMISIGNMDMKIDRFMDESKSNELKFKVLTLEGKNLRLENEVYRLNQKIQELEYRGMRENLLFYNITEEEYENCEEKILEILKDNMKVPEDLIYSCDNLFGEVRIDVAHRVGVNSKKTGNRPVVVKFLSRKGKDIVMRFAKNLKGSDYSVSEQLPSVMKEQRAAQVNTLIKLREENEDENVRISLVRNTLIKNGKVIDPQFTHNPLPEVTTVPTSYDDVTHSDLINIRGSIFQGHVAVVNSVENAASARLSLFQNKEVASSHHIMYAYKISNDEINICGNSDDGEVHGSRVLMDILNKSGHENLFVAVSRIHKGPNLGKERFDHIRAAGQDAIIKHNTFN